MYLKYFYDNELAQASYMVGCQKTGEAVVIDPSRHVQEYLNVAEEQGFTITGGLETHIHADFVSGTVELAARTGAVIYHSVEGAENGGYALSSSLNIKGVRDQDRIQIGNVWIDVLHTPGHTPEHVSYLLTDGANPEKPIGVFTGDFVFVGDVGRPDLLEKSVGVEDSADAGARQMFASIQAFKQYEDYLQIWPGHGAGSSCGKALGAVPTSTVGYEKMFNPAFQPEHEQEFVDFLLDGQPEPPAYFANMKEMNKYGAALLSEVRPPVRLSIDAEEMEKLAEESTKMVVDTRKTAAYARGHIPGTINITYPEAFTEWMGWLTDYDSDVYLIGDDKDHEAMKDALYGIGIDRIAGLISTSVVEQAEHLRTYENITPKETKEEQEAGNLRVLDVRFQDEREREHIPGAEHIMLGRLPSTSDQDLPPKDKPVAVHCGSGKRSAIAASILLNKGYDVKNMLGGMMKWKNENLETA
ncbi:MBL fold metallo-hydrolase [Salibacterium halotolerans]|uniref:Hydroxyacylglutathione hydrolase n=1 Tax=Salibacterium halotolerans TaxID=1884432 RepID=A0A1I5YCB6_9BACI|nr:MBL fold metallo-hydrolase [Salibacterium halotolerans]SFQ41836.1 hydroxyacylglutathione hydrolase [Salibacterium halotolerans]